MVFVGLVGGLRGLALLLKSKQLASYGQELSLKSIWWRSHFKKMLFGGLFYL